MSDEQNSEGAILCLERATLMLAECAPARDDRERIVSAVLAANNEHVALLTELRALRRELAARRAVDGWIRENGDRYLEVGVLSGRLNACQAGKLIAHGADYPALAAALGLEVEDREPRQPGCQCHWEVGDSPCPVHGLDEDDPHA